MALSLVLLLSLGAFVLLTWRTRTRDARHATDSDSTENSDRGSGPTGGRVGPRPEEVRAFARPLAAPVVADDDTEAQAQLREWSRWQRRRLPTSPSFAAAYNRYRLARRSDENVFESMKIREVDREAIRRINAEHRLKPRDLAGLSSEARWKLLKSDEAARTVAIGLVLGADGARELFAAESSLEGGAVGANGNPSLASASEMVGVPPDQQGDTAVPAAQAPAGAPDETSSPALIPPSDPGALDAGS
jgi:hypothetical protein